MAPREAGLHGGDFDSKAKTCLEFRQALINSVGKRLVEAVKSDIFGAVVLTHMMLPLQKLYTTQNRTNWDYIWSVSEQNYY